MKYLLILILLLPIISFGQTNSIVTELYLANNFTPKSGITPGSNNTLAMDCDQINARYVVDISGITSTGNRLPSQNQLTVPVGEPCNSELEAGGGFHYPEHRVIGLGSGTGTVYFNADAVSVPDFFRINYNGVAYVIGYLGDTFYDYGGDGRGTFTDACLAAAVDPQYGTTYPDFTHYPDDGYPRIYESTATLFFTKSTASPTTADVYVFSPIGSTVWSFTVSCPQ